MSRFAHHASRRAAEIESGFAHVRYIVAIALLWAVAIVAAVVATVVQEAPATTPAESASPAEAPVAPLGA